MLTSTLREKCPYSEFFWSLLFRIRTEHRDSPYSVQMRENTDQKNSEYEHFSGSAIVVSEVNDNPEMSLICWFQYPYSFHTSNNAYQI